MASSNAVTLFSSVVLGIAVYAEELSASGGGHVASAVGPAVAIVGIVLLGSAEDPPAAEPASAGASPFDSGYVTWLPHLTLPNHWVGAAERGTLGTA